MRAYRVTLEIFEMDGPTPTLPIVVHVFQGRSRNEALGYFRAHEGTDSFFRGAVESGAWNGLRLETRSSEGWVDA